MEQAIKIYFDSVLSFNGQKLASIQEYQLADRCEGSIFEALELGERVELEEGVFELDNDLDLII